MQINVSYDSSVSNAPAAFTAAINYVVSYYDTLFTNPISITIDVGWGEIAGQTISDGSLGESLAQSEDSYTYAQVRNALIAEERTSTQRAAYSTLPTADPTIAQPYYSDGSTVYVVPAEEEALGLISSYNGPVGYVGFSSTADFSYAANVTPAANAYYFIGVAEHEISEVMGRVSQVDSPGISVMDLFRYSAPGVFDFTPTPPRPYKTAYFSIDGGKTNLDYWNTNASGDYGDWAPSAGNDSYDAFGSQGVINTITSADLTVMDVLGWDDMEIVVSDGQTETVSSGQTLSGATVSLGGNLTVSSGGSVTGVTVDGGGVGVVHSGGVASGTTISAAGAEYVTGIDNGAVVYGFQEVAAGGSVSGASFSGGGGQTILSGGVASGVTIGHGSYQYIVGGMVSGVQVGGYQEVDSGGVASNVTVSSGACETVAAGGSAGSVGIAHGGYEYVLSGAVVNGAQLGGYQEVDSGGLASNVTISSGACETVQAGGSASSVAIAYGGFDYVLSGGVVSGVQVGGYQEIDSGGAASNVTVSSGACETVLAGGSAAGVTVAQGGYSFVEGGTVSGGAIFGYQQVDGGRVSGVTISSGGGQNIYSGGIASGVTVALGATEFVYSGSVSGGTVLGYQEIDGSGSAGGVTVSSGGTEAILSGGVVQGAIVAGGREVVSSGGTLDGTLSFIGSGGALILQSRALFNGSISGFGAGDTLNLAGIGFAGATVGYSNNTLTVSDGTHSLSLALLGQYIAAGFSDASNGAGGTLVTYTPPPNSDQIANIAPGH